MTDLPAPADPAALETRVRAVVAGLTTADVQVIACDPALADTAAFCAAYGFVLADSANAIVVVGKASSASVPPIYAMCVVLATTRLDVNRVVRRRLGTKKASFADAGATVGLTGMEIGGVTPFAVPDDLPIWIDAAVMARTRVVVGGGSRSAKVVGPPAMLTELPSTSIVEGLATAIDPS